jgi:hypothetical protein
MQQVSASPTAAASASVSPVDDDCLNSDTRGIVSGMAPVWATVVDSRGQSGHAALVKSFSGLSDDLSKKLRSLCTDHLHVAAAAADLNFDVSLLALGTPKAAPYQAAASSANKLAKVMGVSVTFESPEEDLFTPHKSDFKIGLKIRKKECFGSAGCNVTYRIDPSYEGTEPLPDSGTIEVTYEVRGGEDGPQINTFTIDGDGSAHFDSEEDLSTPKSSTKLKAVATAVSYSNE